MTRKGIHKRWGHKFLVKELACRISEYANLSPEQRVAYLALDAREEAKVSDYADGDLDKELSNSIFALERAARARIRMAAHEVYIGTTSGFSAFRLAVFHSVFQKLLFLGRNKALLGKSNIWAHGRRELSETIAMAYSMGWNGAGDCIGTWTLQLLPLGMDYWKPGGEPQREPFARFVSALFADQAGVQLPEMPPHPCESLAYDDLLSGWRDPDPRALVEPLLAACDWHTHECMYNRSDRPSKNVDFINETLMGLPVEVHMVYRLRERLGLALPSDIDHPLMKTPFGPYVPPQPLPRDARLEKLFERACLEVPGLFELVKPALA